MRWHIFHKDSYRDSTGNIKEYVQLQTANENTKWYKEIKKNISLLNVLLVLLNSVYLILHKYSRFTRQTTEKQTTTQRNNSV